MVQVREVTVHSRVVGCQGTRPARAEVGSWTELDHAGLSRWNPPWKIRGRQWELSMSCIVQPRNRLAGHGT